VQGFFLKTEVVEKLRRNRPSNSLKGKCREAACGKSERSVAGWRAGERVSWGDTSSFRSESSKEERTVEIL
jgi:hypothetical protein